MEKIEWGLTILLQKSRIGLRLKIKTTKKGIFL